MAAREMLRAPTLAAIPYLMEDVAHGSVEYYGSYSLGDVVIGGRRVREAAVEQVADLLFMTPEFTGETLECVKAIAKGYAGSVQGLSDESRYLVQWWLLNESAFEAVNWKDARPLPQKITYADPEIDTSFIFSSEGWDPEKQPPYGSPAWELSESFEAWSKRIEDPKRRNLGFVALS